MLPQCNSSMACTCQYNSHMKYETCNCPAYFDPYYFCNRTIFEAYNGLDLIYPSFGLIIYSILFILYMYECVADILQKKITPILLTKGTLTIFLLSRLVILSLWIVSSNKRTTIYASITTFINSIGTIIMIGAIILIIISWLELVLSAKTLGDRNRSISHIKLILFILTVVIGFTNIIFLFLVEFIPKVSELMTILTITVILLLVLTVIAIIISIVYLIIILRWIKSKIMTKFLHKVQIKSYWLITILGSLLTSTIITAATQAFEKGIPSTILTTEIMNRCVEILIISLTFLFLERKFIKALHNRNFIISSNTSTTNTAN